MAADTTGQPGTGNAGRDLTAALALPGGRALESALRARARTAVRPGPPRGPRQAPPLSARLSGMATPNVIGVSDAARALIRGGFAAASPAEIEEAADAELGTRLRDLARDLGMA